MHHFTNKEKTFFFSLSKNNPTFLVNSSTKVKKYWLPPRDGTSNDPHIYECTTPRICLALWGASDLNIFFWIAFLSYNLQKSYVDTMYWWQATNYFFQFILFHWTMGFHPVENHKSFDFLLVAPESFHFLHEPIFLANVCIFILCFEFVI